jgi:hypothetical protein
MVFGKKGTGKSNWVQYVLQRSAYRAHLMFDVCAEHDALNRYVPEYRRGEQATAEVEQVVNSMVLNVDSDRRPDLLAVEEVSRFCSPRTPPPEPLYELVDMNRHYGVGLLGVARRPAQVHTDMVDLADNLVIFRLTGAADKRRLRNISEGLDEAVAGLDDYQYVQVRPDGAYVVRDPVPEQDTTGDL